MMQRLEDMAAGMHGFASRSSMGLNASFLTDYWREGLKIFTAAWQTPFFAPEDLSRAKQEHLAKLRSQQDVPEYPAFAALRNLLYADHPLGRDPLGDTASIAAITSQDLRKLHHELRLVKGATLVIVGDVNPQEVQAEIEHLWGQEAPLNQAPVCFPLPPASGAHIERIKSQGEQTHILVGFRAPSIMEQEQYAVQVLEAILGGAGGRLFTDLRDRQALVYTVQPYYNLNALSGSFGIYLACAPDKQATALASVRRQLDLISNIAVSDLELARGKNYILGSDAIDQQNYAFQAITMANAQALGLGYDHNQKIVDLINSLTPDEIMAAARKLFAPNLQATVIQGRIE
jgi:zinc protease